MGVFRQAMGYPLLRAGIILLVLSLVISVLGFYRVDRFYSSNGTLGEGMHYLGDDKFEGEYLYHNRTLILSSSGANVTVIQGTQMTNYTLTRERLVLHPSLRPVIYVFDGSVNYTYNATAVDYPYASYSLFAFILMLVGVVLAFLGYSEFIRDVKEGRK